MASLTARYYCADPDSKKRLQSVGLVHIATSCILCWNITKLTARHSKTWTGGENKCDFVARNVVWRRFTNNGQQTTTVPRMCFEFYTLICYIFFAQSKLLSPMLVHELKLVDFLNTEEICRRPPPEPEKWAVLQRGRGSAYVGRGLLVKYLDWDYSWTTKEVRSI